MLYVNGHEIQIQTCIQRSELMRKNNIDKFKLYNQLFNFAGWKNLKR